VGTADSIDKEQIRETGDRGREAMNRHKTGDIGWETKNKDERE
jgi:hypothetical protein